MLFRHLSVTDILLPMASSSLIYIYKRESCIQSTRTRTACPFFRKRSTTLLPTPPVAPATSTIPEVSIGFTALLGDGSEIFSIRNANNFKYKRNLSDQTIPNFSSKNQRSIKQAEPFQEREAGQRKTMFSKTDLHPNLVFQLLYSLCGFSSDGMITFSGKQLVLIYAGEKNLEGETEAARNMEMMKVNCSQQLRHPAT